MRIYGRNRRKLRIFIYTATFLLFGILLVNAFDFFPSAHRLDEGYIDFIEVLRTYDISYRYHPYLKKLTVYRGPITLEVFAAEDMILSASAILYLDAPPKRAKGSFYITTNALMLIFPDLFGEMLTEEERLTLIESDGYACLYIEGTAVMPVSDLIELRYRIIREREMKEEEKRQKEKSREEAQQNTMATNTLAIISNQQNSDTDNNKKQRIEAIIIDAGHGGKDPGAIGVGDLYEKDVVLPFSFILKEKIEEICDAEVTLTRTKDEFLTLKERSKTANGKAGIGTDAPKNTVFISIHANAAYNKERRGFEIYFLSADDSSDYARSKAAFENSVTIDFEKDTKYESSADMLINRMLVEQYQKESKQLADMIAEKVSDIDDIVVEDSSVHSALFYVLKGVLMPAVLVELGFLTNPQDASLLKRADIRLKMADSIANAVKEYMAIFEKTDGFTK